MATTKTVTLRLAPELLAQIDETRGLVPREAWLRQAAAEKLGRILGMSFKDPATGEWRPFFEHPGLHQPAAGGGEDA